jgi:hypothetical protein
MNVRDLSPRGQLLVLVTSPLLGPSSWSPLREELAARGWETLVPVDLRDPTGRQAFWERAVGGVERSLSEVPHGRPVVLVGHSGAGKLLPAIAGAIRQPVAAYIFVDAGLPAGGKSRLQAMPSEGPDGAAFASELASALEAGGRYPEWTDAELAPLVPDPKRRRVLLTELRPRGREFWTEPLPTVAPWPDAPCAYLQFSDGYEWPAGLARSLGWPVRHLPSGHFHQLVDERDVADVLLELLAQIGQPEARPQVAEEEM